MEKCACISLRESYERIVEARANVCLQGGQLKPNGNLISEYSYRKNSQNSRPFVAQNGDPFNFFALGIDASWEPDLFGKIKRTIEAADAELKFQESEYEFIRQTLYADIVSSYLRIRLLQSQVNLLQESLAVQGQTAALVSGRMEAGVSTELDQSQTESFRHRTDALMASIRRQVEIEFNQLALLMGQTPDKTLRNFVGMMPIPAMPPIPAVGLPADLLRRRPDVWREEMSVRAASAQIGIAEADLYPQLTLLGTVSVSSKNISGLFETNGLEFQVGPSVEWNVLNFNRINNNIEIQEARFRQAIVRYQNVALGAVRDVEDALVNHQGYMNQWNAFQSAVIEDKKAVTLSLERYKAGKANFQRVLDAQQQLIDDQSQGYDAQAQAITQLVRLYKAAGGGWEGGGAYASFSAQACDLTGQPISTPMMQAMPTPAIPMQAMPMTPMDSTPPMQSAPPTPEGLTPDSTSEPTPEPIPFLHPVSEFQPAPQPANPHRYSLTEEIANQQRARQQQFQQSSFGSSNFDDIVVEIGSLPPTDKATSMVKDDSVWVNDN